MNKKSQKIEIEFQDVNWTQNPSGRGGCQTIGFNSRGSIESKEEFLKFVLNNPAMDEITFENNTDFKDCLLSLPFAVSTKYLRDMCECHESNKSRRITEVINKADLMTIPVFSNVRNKVGLPKTFKQVVDKKSIEIAKEQLRKIDEKRTRDNLRWLDFYTQDEFNKAQNQKLLKIPVTCKCCGKKGLIPIMPNIEIDYYEQKVSKVYDWIINDMEEGIHFCPKCNRENKVWKEKIFKQDFNKIMDIKKIIEAIDKNQVIILNKEDFIESYHRFKRNIDIQKIKDFLMDYLIENIDYPFDFDIKTRSDNLIISFKMF